MNVSDIAALKGKALDAKAAELSIAGRSKMTAEEKRAAITIALHGHNELPDTEPFALPDPFNDLDEEIEADFEASAQAPIFPSVPDSPWSIKNIVARVREAVDFKRLSGAQASAAATVTAPLTTAQRLANYRKQNGTNRITPAQARRARKRHAKLSGSEMILIANTASLGR